MAPFDRFDQQHRYIVNNAVDLYFRQKTSFQIDRCNAKRVAEVHNHDFITRSRIMRKFAIATIALIAIITNANCSFGQSYPWSADSTPSNYGVQSNQVPQQPSTAYDLSQSSNRMQRVPQAPSMTPNPLLASSRKQEGENQPSLSDVQEFSYENAPGQAPDDAYQSVFDSQNPGLAVQSTAGVEPNYCCRDCSRHRCDLGCVKRIFGSTPGGLKVGGWGSFGYHNRDTILFNDRSGTVNPHQVWLYAEKEAARQGNWGFGFRFDTLYGIDAQNTQAIGNRPTGSPDSWDNDFDYGDFGWAMPQAYVQMANDRWDVKVGKFFSPAGYERVQAPENFFYSHTYTFNFSQPFTLTGVVGETQVSPNRTFLVGVTSGWDTGFNQNNDGFTLITGTRHRFNENAQVYFGGSLGDTGYRGTGQMFSGVADLRLTENVRYVGQLNSLNLQDNQEFGFVNYLFRDISCCFGLGARLEWWKSDQLFNDTKSTWEFTMGANYKPNANIVFRPEVRWDWGAAAIDPGATIAGFDIVMLY